MLEIKIAEKIGLAASRAGGAGFCCRRAPPGRPRPSPVSPGPAPHLPLPLGGRISASLQRGPRLPALSSEPAGACASHGRDRARCRKPGGFGSFFPPLKPGRPNNLLRVTRCRSPFCGFPMFGFSFQNVRLRITMPN